MSLINKFVAEAATEQTAKAVIAARLADERVALKLANKAAKAAKKALNGAKARILSSKGLETSWKAVQASYEAMDSAKSEAARAEKALSDFRAEAKVDLAITRTQALLSTGLRAALRQIVDLGTGNSTQVDQACSLVTSGKEAAMLDRFISASAELEEAVNVSNETLVAAGNSWHKEAQRHGALRLRLLVEGTRIERAALRRAERKVQEHIRALKEFQRKLGLRA